MDDRVVDIDDGAALWVGAQCVANRTLCEIEQKDDSVLVTGGSTLCGALVLSQYVEHG